MLNKPWYIASFHILQSPLSRSLTSIANHLIKYSDRFLWHKSLFSAWTIFCSASTQHLRQQHCFIFDDQVKRPHNPKITHKVCDSPKLILITRLDLLKVLCTCQEGSLGAQSTISRAEPQGKLEEKAAGWTQEETNKRTAKHCTFIAEKKVKEITNSQLHVLLKGQVKWPQQLLPRCFYGLMRSQLKATKNNFQRADFWQALSYLLQTPCTEGASLVVITSTDGLRTIGTERLWSGLGWLRGYPSPSCLDFKHVFAFSFQKC